MRPAESIGLGELIGDLDVIRHGGLPRLFARLQACSTCGVWLRGFTHGHVRQLSSAAGEALVRSSQRVSLLPGAGQLAFIDIDAKIKEAYGHGKDGIGTAYDGGSVDPG